MSTGGAGGLALALKNPQFRLYTFGGTPSLLGTWIQRVAVAWLAWQLTESYTWVGAIAMVDMMPVVFIAPIAGAFADRVDRIRVCRLLQVANMAQASGLMALSVADLISIEILLAFSLMTGVINAIFQPFRHSIIANMVSREELPGAIAINSTTWHGSRFIGPAIAGGVIAAWGVSAAFLINALSYLPFIYALYRIKLPAPSAAARGLREMPREIVEGVRYAFSHRVIGPVLFVLFVSSCVGRAVLEQLPGFASQVFSRGEGGFATMVSAAGFGAMLGALWFGWRAHRSSLVRIIVANVLLLTVGLLGLVASHLFELAILSLMVTGFGMLVSGIAIQTIVQGTVDETLRGRVMGIYGWFWVGVPGVGAIVIGAVSDVTGPRWPVFVGAILVLLVWIWALRRQSTISAAVAPVER